MTETDKKTYSGSSKPGLRIILMGVAMLMLSAFNVMVASSPESFEVKKNLALQINTATLIHSFSILIIAAIVAYRAKVLYNSRWKDKF
jgi:ABC-type uncharacterized transport system permease subunit